MSRTPPPPPARLAPITQPSLSALPSRTPPLRLGRSLRHHTCGRSLPFIAGVILAAAMVAPTFAAGRTFYLATSSDDSNSGSISHPWRSFHASLKKLRAGDTLYVRGGSYTFQGPTTTLAGTSTSRILISAYPGEPIFTEHHDPGQLPVLLRATSAYITLRADDPGRRPRRPAPMARACSSSSTTPITSGSRREPPHRVSVVGLSPAPRVRRGALGQRHRVQVEHLRWQGLLVEAHRPLSTRTHAACASVRQHP